MPVWPSSLRFSLIALIHVFTRPLSSSQSRHQKPQSFTTIRLNAKVEKKGPSAVLASKSTHTTTSVLLFFSQSSWKELLRRLPRWRGQAISVVSHIHNTRTFGELWEYSPYINQRTDWTSTGVIFSSFFHSVFMHKHLNLLLTWDTHTFFFLLSDYINKNIQSTLLSFPPTNDILLLWEHKESEPLI